MRTDELLEQCLQALTSGQDLPPDLARYLARHPEQRAEVEELIAVAQRASRLAPAELSTARRTAMQARLAARLGLDAPAVASEMPVHTSIQEPAEEAAVYEAASRKKPFLTLGRVSLAKLRYEPPQHHPDDISEARIRAAFRDLTPEDIRRYIGVRGEDYLYYRQGLPGWEPVFLCIATVLRGLKRLEKVASQAGQ